MWWCGEVDMVGGVVFLMVGFFTFYFFNFEKCIK